MAADGLPERGEQKPAAELHRAHEERDRGGGAGEAGLHHEQSVQQAAHRALVFPTARRPQERANYARLRGTSPGGEQAPYARRSPTTR